MHFLQAHEPWVVLPKGRKKLSFKNKTLLKFQFASLLTNKSSAINALNIIIENSRLEKDRRRAYLKRGEIFYKLNEIKNACSDWNKAKDAGELEAQSKVNKHCKT